MHNISVIRVNLLRAGYLLLVVGLGAVVWPSILNPAKTWELIGSPVTGKSPEEY